MCGEHSGSRGQWGWTPSPLTSLHRTSLQASQTHRHKPLPYNPCRKPSPAWCGTQLAFVVPDRQFKAYPIILLCTCPPLLSAHSAAMTQTLLPSWNLQLLLTFSKPPLVTSQAANRLINRYHDIRTSAILQSTTSLLLSSLKVL